ncbi:hypothetical protein LTR70_003567 [Exophiala xenobiotica]|nr:hypothetical protein LTR70_003567 [Exophiala xenobiotica]
MSGHGNTSQHSYSMTGQTPQQQSQHGAGTLSTIPSTLSSALPQPQPQSQSAAVTTGQKDIDSMTKSQVRYLDTATAYDLWSSVYDTDGNFLQALDSIEMQTLLPRAMSLLQAQFQAEDRKQANRNIKAVDLGCGTGRNTLQLLEVPTVTNIVGLELSPKMMEIARSRCETRLEEIRVRSRQAQHHDAAQSQQNLRLDFESFNMLNHSPPSTALNADLVLSTLVLEHIPLATFFTCASSLLRPGGTLLLTNMHADMGRVSQAGFVDPETNQKVRPESYVYSVADVLTAAGEAGLDVVGSVKEVSVDEELAGRLGARGRKWVGVKVWFGGVWRKRREGRSRAGA